MDTMKTLLWGRLRRPRSPYTYTFLLEDSHWVHFRREKRSGSTEPWRLMTLTDLPSFIAAMSRDGWRVEEIGEEIETTENFWPGPVYKSK